ncbi:prolyl 4-hydroxylase alpha subunit-like protein [Skeletonema marinoi]|uniref:Prolyl 4-hydroxylase alpha subunit-like protein n=1 Tax=Skeletonema marinoi TaxID=267567 RepID=A0AAD8XYY4_9STRA|nr:prolyl 4-hydroxylase alpha subunit-like protein [Skeletonema marinoi]
MRHFYIVVAFFQVLSVSASSSHAGCADVNESNCKHWSSIGECDKNPGYMHRSCKRSCNTCTAEDIDITARQAVRISDQDISGVWWMNSSEKQDFLDDIMSYLKDEVWAVPEYTKTQGICFNKDNMCTHWAMQGRCSEVDVKLNCGPSCGSCMYLDENVRCGGTIEQLPNALSAGSIDKMFKRIVRDYDVQILSQPTQEQDKPWIVTIDDFVSDEEINLILDYGQKTGYEQAGEVYSGNHAAPAKTQKRTSETSWCGFQFGDTCFEEPLIKGLLNRVYNVTHVPIPNFNEMQILRYQPGQSHSFHGDYIEEDSHRRVGGRILTFFMYLNDVEGGGETEFSRLSPPIKITPTKGKVLLWANVLDSDPHKEDERVWHQALTVHKGEKHAANLWLQMRDYRTPVENKCAH